MTRAQTEHSGGSIDPEIVCMSGHAEARERLEALGWSEPDIGTLEDAVEGYEDFARCVAGEIKYRRE